MSPDPSSSLGEAATRIRALHEARARAEVEQALALSPGSDVVSDSGNLMGEIVLVKGLPGPAEAAGGAALSGPDGEAAEKALVALGWPADSWYATLSRSWPDADRDESARRLRMIVEAVNPRVVVALDAVAAEDLARASEIAGLLCGHPVRVLGRTMVAVDGFETSLGDAKRKKAVWRELQAAAPPGPVY
jgi:hypothetical protein